MRCPNYKKYNFLTRFICHILTAELFLAKHKRAALARGPPYTLRGIGTKPADQWFIDEGGKNGLTDYWTQLV